MLNKDIKNYIDRSVLCWLATVSEDHFPNVSPKEIFSYLDDEHLIIAHIASPRSVKNIRTNPNVCVSFIDIFLQKGYQLKGQAELVAASDPSFAQQAAKLIAMAGDAFPIQALIKIKVTGSKPILAPRYVLFPETTEEAQIEEALKSYGFVEAGEE